MSLLASLLTAVTAAFVVMTVLQTAAEYRALPARVPLGFYWSGRVGRPVARPLTWYVPVTQVLVAGVMAAVGLGVVQHAPESFLRYLVFAVCVNVMIWRVQSMMLSAAKSGANRVPMPGFVLLSCVCFALMSIALFAVR